MTGGDAAVVLGVHRQRVRQLSNGDLLPYVVHRDGTRLYRRQQLEVLAHNRGAQRRLLYETRTG